MTLTDSPLSLSDFKSEVFMVDFEKTENSAIRTHFHNTIIKGCLFHCKQRLLRRFRKITGCADNLVDYVYPALLIMGRIVGQANNELMKSDLHAVYGLAFVPINDVCLGWNLLKPFLTQYRATATFISYFESNWLNFWEIFL